MAPEENEGFEQVGGAPQEGAATPEPTPPSPTAADGAAEEPEYLEIRNRDDSWQIESDAAQQMAERLGLNVDQFRQALQIGMDGTRLYERLNDEQDRLRQAWAELAEARRQASGTPSPQPSPTSPAAARQRPTDIAGSIFWTAEQFDRLSPLPDRLERIEQMLATTHQRIEDAELNRERAEERVASLQAYQDVSQVWRKNGQSLPSYNEMVRVLRRIPLSDDPDMTWHEIWDRVGWMVAGPAIAKKGRREAVREIQNNRGMPLPAPGRGAAPGMAPASRPPTSGSDKNEDLEAEAASIERQLGAMTLGDAMGGGR